MTWHEAVYPKTTEAHITAPFEVILPYEGKPSSDAPLSALELRGAPAILQIPSASLAIVPIFNLPGAAARRHRQPCQHLP